MAIVNLILATPNIRPGLVLDRVAPIPTADLREINIVELGRALAERGHDVVVYVADPFLEDGDVRIDGRLVIRGMPTEFSRLFHPSLLPLTPELPRILERDAPDLIQCAEFHHPATYLASRAAAASGTPLIVWQEIFHRMRAPGSWYEHAYELTAGPAIRRTTSRFVLRTLKAQAYLQALGIPSERIGPWVPTGVDTTVFRPKQSSMVPDAFGFGEGCSIILVVARLNPDKRVDLAIRAVARLLKAGADVGLVIRGSGPEEPYLKSLANRLEIRDRVRFHPRVSREELVDLYNAADVFLLTSRGDLELLPFTVLQAAACSLPIVTTAAGSVPDVVQDGVNGFIIQDESPEGVANRLRSLLGDEELRKSIGRQARLRAERVFDMRVVARSFEGVYGETLDSRARH